MGGSWLLDMLIAVSGTKYSGVETLIELLVKRHGFELIDSKVQDPDVIMEYATKFYTKNLVLHCQSLELCTTLEKRPFFVHLSIDASIGRRMKKLCATVETNDIDELCLLLDEYDFRADTIKLREKANVKIKILNDNDEAKLDNVLEEQLNILANKKKDNPEEINPPLRPDWDTYFMKLATLAASRSNCMKRKVGCVIVRDNRVIATGYNGTPRHLTNCCNGGCPRCNGGNSHDLHTCLCLHAEENALLEAGRDRIGDNAILYCDTCPCLTCSVKIVQTGIVKVVYSQSYRMDESSFKVLKDGGIDVRQFSYIEEPSIVIV